MNNPLKQGILMEHSTGIGTVTRGMVRERAVELAQINGRSPQDVSNTDWDQAKRELTGQSEIDPKDEILESAAESDRWDPIHGSTGTKSPATFGEDEDEEGLSDSARLFEGGIHEAEHDQMLQATRAKPPLDER
ncbi:MAG: hypothetical protein WCP60_07875 [bacterium]